MTTETLDKLYLEYSNLTKARSEREMQALGNCQAALLFLERGETDNAVSAIRAAIKILVTTQ